MNSVSVLERSNKTHFMVDLETLALTPNARILSIGAVKFNRDRTSATYFYSELSSSYQSHRKVDSNTEEWWASQGNMPKGIDPIDKTLINFANWLVDNTIPGTEPELWAKGTDFDIPILYNVMRDFNIISPWKYNNVSDLRTLKKYLKPTFEVPENPNPHNALDDAIHQAAWVVSLIGDKL